MIARGHRHTLMSSVAGCTEREVAVRSWLHPWLLHMCRAEHARPTAEAPADRRFSRQCNQRAVTEIG